MELIIFAIIIAVLSLVRTLHLFKRQKQEAFFELSDYIIFGGICLWIALGFSYVKEFCKKLLVKTTTFDQLKFGECFCLASVGDEQRLTRIYSINDISRIYVKNTKDTCIPLKVLENEEEILPYQIYSKTPVYHIYYNANKNPVLDMPSIFLEFPSIKKKFFEKHKINIENLR